MKFHFFISFFINNYFHCLHRHFIRREIQIGFEEER
jgi:hypothetical protein